MLESKNILSGLINSGADASTNLYEATFSFQNDSLNNLVSSYNASVRLTKVDIPSFSLNTINIPFKNINITKIGSGIEIDKTVNISFRIDENYKLYKALLTLLINDQTGNFEEDTSNKRFQLKISLIKPSSSTASGLSLGFQEPTFSTGYEETASWLFYDCLLFKIQKINYTYDSSNNIVIQCSLTYSTFDFN